MPCQPFLEEQSGEPGYQHKKLTASAKKIQTHIWPGNVRELQNTLRRATLFAEGMVISADDMRRSLLPRPANAENPDAVMNLPVSRGLDLPRLLDRVRVHYIDRAIDFTGGNKSKAAEILGIDPSTLYRKLNRYGIEV